MPLKPYNTAPVSTCSCSCDEHWWIHDTTVAMNLTNTATDFCFWTWWMALRWPWKQRQQAYPLQSLKRLPISKCAGKNKAEYSKMKVTLTVQRGRQRGHCAGIKDNAWIEVCGRGDVAHTSTVKATSWFRDCRICCLSRRLITRLREVLLWHLTVPNCAAHNIRCKDICP